MFLQNRTKYLLLDMASHARRLESSLTLLVGTSHFMSSCNS